MRPLDAKVTLIKDGKKIGEFIPFNRPSEGPVLLCQPATEKTPEMWSYLGCGSIRKYRRVLPSTTDGQGFVEYYGLTEHRGEAHVTYKPGVVDREVLFTDGARWMDPIRHEIHMDDDTRERLLGVSQPQKTEEPPAPTSDAPTKAPTDREMKLHLMGEAIRMRFAHILHRG